MLSLGIMDLLLECSKGSMHPFILQTFMRRFSWEGSSMDLTFILLAMHGKKCISTLIDHVVAPRDNLEFPKTSAQDILNCREYKVYFRLIISLGLSTFSICVKHHRINGTTLPLDLTSYKDTAETRKESSMCVYFIQRRDNFHRRGPVSQ